MNQPLIHRPFAFDTEFDSDGAVLQATAFRPAKRAYLPNEVEALLAQARVEARQAALDEVDGIRALALSSVAESLAASLPTLTRVIQTHREQSAGLAMAAARVMAAGALEQVSTAPLKSAIEQLGQEIDASPRLVIRTAGLDDAVQTQIQSACVDAGFTGVCVFRDETDLAAAAFQLEWADGRADFDPAEAASRVEEALATALAAEAGHGEPVATHKDNGSEF